MLDWLGNFCGAFSVAHGSNRIFDDGAGVVCVRAYVRARVSSYCERVSFRHATHARGARKHCMCSNICTRKNVWWGIGIWYSWDVLLCLSCSHSFCTHARMQHCVAASLYFAPPPSFPPACFALFCLRLFTNRASEEFCVVGSFLLRLLCAMVRHASVQKVCYLHLWNISL